MKNNTESNRTQETMSENFVTKPGDVFAIIGHEGVISNTIEVRVTNDNTKENFTLTFSNVIESWKLFKMLSEFRSVICERHCWGGKVETCNYVDSEAYKHRFEHKMKSKHFVG